MSIWLHQYMAPLSSYVASNLVKFGSWSHQDIKCLLTILGPVTHLWAILQEILKMTIFEIRARDPDSIKNLILGIYVISVIVQWREIRHILTCILLMTSGLVQILTRIVRLNISYI